MVKIIRSLELLGFVIWGVNVFEYILLQSMGHISGLFPNLNADLVTIATILGLIVMIVNLWIRYDRHRIFKKAEAENLQALKNKNIADEMNNFTFDRIIRNIPPEQFKESEDRLKK